MKRLTGFTLMEVLVVLVLVGLTTSLLFTAIFSAGNIFSRLDSANDYVNKERSAVRWLRSAIGASLAVNKKDAAHFFVGTETAIEATTMLSVFSYPGKLVRFSVRLEEKDGGMVLQYAEGLSSFSDFLALGSNAKFEYVNSRGAFFSAWPPEPGLRGLLPSNIVVRSQGKIPIYFDILLRRQPLEDLRDLL